MNDYEKLIEAKNKIAKLPQVQRTYLCGGGTSEGDIIHKIATHTHDGRLFFIKPEDADKADEIINAK